MRNKFEDWRDRVKKHLPFIVTKFYQCNKHIDYSMHKKLGQVISDINNPFYTIQDYYGKPVDETGEMGLQIVLKIQVEDLFSFVQNNC